MHSIILYHPWSVRWFLDDSVYTLDAKEHIELLYGGGDYTLSRIIPHSLMHYEAFERLFLARCGKSISAHTMLAQLAAAGGLSVEQQAERLIPLVFEANAIREQQGHDERYSIELHHLNTAMGYDNVAGVAELELYVVESQISTDDANGQIFLSKYSPNEFVHMLRQLRAHHQPFGLASTNLSFLVSQWQVFEAVESIDFSFLYDVAKEAVLSVQDLLKTLLGFTQVCASLLFSLPDIAWPSTFRDIGEFFGNFNFDFINADFLQASLKASTDACSNTLALLHIFTFYLLSLLGAYKIITWMRSLPIHHHQVFFDRVIYLLIASCFTMYPVLAMRTIRLYALRQFGSIQVLDQDWRLNREELGSCQVQGGVFILLYVVGIPFVFFLVLLDVSRSLEEVDLSKSGSELALIKEKRQLTRFGMIYSNYKKSCWWWELVELSRKLLLSGVLSLISPRTTSQVWIALILSLLFLLLTIYFMPFEDQRINALTTASHLCTTLTLLIALASRLGLAKEGVLQEDIMSKVIIAISLVPFAVAVYLIVSVIQEAIATRKHLMKQRKKLPGAMRDEEPTLTTTEKTEYGLESDVRTKTTWV